jgi:hypothetical protein
MQVTHPRPARTPRHDALAAGVRSASEMAVKSLHAAADDRRFVHEQEWNQSTYDTLADIDEVADTLQGISAWVVGGMPHPEPGRILNTLSELQGSTPFDLRAKLLGELRRCNNLLDYVGRLSDLRQALFDFFSYTDESNVEVPALTPGSRGCERTEGEGE